MPYRRTPAVEARLARQRAAICTAAADVLADSGYGACTVAAVAARCGVASGTVYNHFTSKSELVAEVFRTIVSREVDAVRRAVTRHDHAADQVAAVIETFAGRALKQPRRAYALLVEPVDAGVDVLRLEFRRAYRDVIAHAIATGVRTGELPPQDASIVAAALVGAVGEALVGPLSSSGRTEGPDPDTIPTLVRFAQRAIGGPL